MPITVGGILFSTSKKRIKVISVFIVVIGLGVLGSILTVLNTQSQLQQKECPQAQTTTVPVRCPEQDCPTAESTQLDFSTESLNSPQNKPAGLSSLSVQYLGRESQATGQGFSGKTIRRFKGNWSRT